MMMVRKSDFLITNWEAVKAGTWVEGIGEVVSHREIEIVKFLATQFQLEYDELQKQSNQQETQLTTLTAEVEELRGRLEKAISAIDRAIQEAEWCYGKIDRDQEVKAMKLLGELAKDLKKRKESILSHAPSEQADDGRIYLCAKCGTMRTKEEGGTTFTVCDECWEKSHPGTHTSSDYIFHEEGLAWSSKCFKCGEITDFGNPVYTEKETGNAFCIKCISHTPSEWVMVRRSHAETVLKWVNILAQQAAIHLPCDPVPELVEATTSIQAALEPKP